MNKRLETREAAQEIIERLHGRMVRGWNEPGCRISVRFADSAEQREMRVSLGFLFSFFFLSSSCIVGVEVLTARGKGYPGRRAVSESAYYRAGCAS
jgi:hypothetical protein